MPRDFVTGFHKRKKKRRKIAQRQIEEKDRRKRIEIRKQVILLFDGFDISPNLIRRYR